MTGELFALLRDHSILGRPARTAIADRDEAADAVAAVAGAGQKAPTGLHARAHAGDQLVHPIGLQDRMIVADVGLVIDFDEGRVAAGSPIVQ